MTNGTNYYKLDKILSQIDTISLKKLNISVGLNSWLKNYDSIINKKHYIFQTIDICHNYRPIRVGLVDFKYDKQKARNVKKILQEKNVQDLSFEVAYPVGRAAHFINIEDYLSTSLELKLHEVHKKENNKNSELNKPHSCDLILKHSTLDPLGNVRPCALFPLDQTIGNLFNDGVKVFRNKNLANFLTMPSPCKQICGNCEYLHYCQGCVYKGFFSNKDNKVNCKYTEYLKSMNYSKLFKG